MALYVKRVAGQQLNFRADEEGWLVRIVGDMAAALSVPTAPEQVRDVSGSSMYYIYKTGSEDVMGYFRPSNQAVFGAGGRTLTPQNVENEVPMEPGAAIVVSYIGTTTPTKR